MEPRFATIVHALRAHARDRSEARAYVFLDERAGEKDSLTFRELDHRAAALAAVLSARAEPGERVLLAFPPGLEFIVGFFACQYAGLIAVPTILPWRNQLRASSLGIVENCAPRLGLTVRGVLAAARAAYAEVADCATEWIAVDDENPSCASGERLAPSTDALAFLQYTSGSTSAPKGVMVSHGNLAANCEMIALADDLGQQSTRVGWIPLYHDMGLIFNALQATFVGALSVLMAPLAFVRRPLSWLHAIHAYRADMAIAPNFAYDLCLEQYHPERMAGVDLSHWRLALNGAEPVRSATLERFARTFAAHGLRASAPHPTYGMAEATLMISGGMHSGTPRVWKVSRAAFQSDYAREPEGDEPAHTLVGCGKSLPAERVAAVDPISHERLPPGRVGELWVLGPHIAQGYWHNPDATRETFHAEISDEPGCRWLRTGDLGCVGADGEVYVTGRIKDVVIVRGANYYPQDLEWTAERSHPALRPGYGAAFLASRDERDVLVVVHEVRRERLRTLDVAEVAAAVRAAMVREHELTVHSVVLVPPGSIPKTTSGKIKRKATRELWETKQLEVLTGPSRRSGIGEQAVSES